MAHPKRDYITLSDQNNEPIFVRIMDSIWWLMGFLKIKSEVALTRWRDRCYSK